MKTLEPEILQLLQTLKKKLAQEDSIHLIGVFGSVAKQKNNALSDIDILYTQNGFFEKYTGLRAINRLEDIREEIRQALKLPVDLVYREGLSKEMSESVHQHIITL